MKQKLILILLTILFFSGCKNQEDYLELSESVYTLNSDATTLTIDLKCNTSWKIINDETWCTIDNMQGIGDTKLTISISKNETNKERIAKIFVESGINYRAINIKQISSNADLPYSLPVVFHVLYYNQADANQYVKKGWLGEVLEKCNALYKNKIDMGIEFVAATTDPNGVTLEEPGVNRVLVNNPAIDVYKFMSNNNKEANSMLWDLNKYINVFIFKFTNNTDGSQETIGISHLPYTVTANPLVGLAAGDYYIGKSKPDNYAHCLSLNNRYIYDLSSDTEYYPTDIVNTLAHELGHYIGLFHAFYTKEDETDYCDDTPNYDRDKYENLLSNLITQGRPFSELVKRTSFEGVQYNSTNIMDYYVSYSNEFTENQRKRTRHVLNYSPMIPGPKLNSKTKSNDQTVPEMRYIE